MLKSNFRVGCDIKTRGYSEQRYESCWENLPVRAEVCSLLLQTGKPEKHSSAAPRAKGKKCPDLQTLAACCSCCVIYNPEESLFNC